MEEKKKLIGVKIKGKSDELWNNLKDKFLLAINDILDTVVDPNQNTTLKDEIKDFSSLLLSYGKNKLAKPGLENQKILAEIELIYTTKMKELAEARKLFAEADRITFETKMKKLKLSLSLFKVLVSGNENEEKILITRQIDMLVRVMNQLEEEK